MDATRHSEDTYISDDTVPRMRNKERINKNINDRKNYLQHKVGYTGTAAATLLLLLQCT